jgi:hypothetical protein
MTVCGRTFNTLKDYLKWLEAEWHTFEEPLYTLDDYLIYGRDMWYEVWCLPPEL